MTNTTTIVVADELADVFPLPQPDARYIRDRRRDDRLHPGRERRHLAPVRLERHDAGLAVVHTCPDCGRVSVVPWRPGGLVTFRCDCAIADQSAARRRQLVVAASLTSLWLLNLADIVLTRKALSLGAVEANVLMGSLLGLGFVWGALIKVGFVTLGSLLLWHERRRHLVYVGSVGLALVYGVLVIYQLVGLALVT